jgi:hypothetical protein
MAGVLWMVPLPGWLSGRGAPPPKLWRRSTASRATAGGNTGAHSSDHGLMRSHTLQHCNMAFSSGYHSRTGSAAIC